MRNIRLHAVLLAAPTLAGCFTFPYEYLELTGENVEITETGRPRVDTWHHGGGPIPLSYALEEPGVSLTLAVGPLSGPPNLVIVSSVRIRAVSIEPQAIHGVARPTSPFEYSLEWWDFRITLDNPKASHVGHVVQIRVELEGRADPVLISGVIAQSGKTTEFDFAGP
ncbi:MAG TPA: hypothetical protein VIC71_05065 [Gammaproteobacteria bacterium]|jgi:hypothetical protein